MQSPRHPLSLRSLRTGWELTVHVVAGDGREEEGCELLYYRNPVFKWFWAGMAVMVTLYRYCVTRI